MKIIITILFCFFTLFLSAQPFERFDYLRVSNNGTPLQYPWTGGLGACLFGKADVNRDGLKDLVVYDKTNNKYCVLISQSNGTTNYKYERKFASHFPSIRGWFVLKDYNCDGIEDFFTASNLSSIAVYKGYYDSDTLKFTLQQDEIYHNATNNVYSNEILKPAIFDYNKDGDLDVIGFNPLGVRLVYYENQRIESNLKCDSMYFNKMDDCWGNVTDTFASAFKIRDTCDFKPTLRQEQILHSGSFVDAIDVDNNGVSDLLIGSVSLSHVTMLYNFGTTTYASILKQDPNYPSYNTPYNVSSFAAPYFIDVNNDNKLDLLVSTFDVSSSNYNNIWFYKNTRNDSINLVLQQKNFLLDNTIDAGENSYPCIFDIDGDGLKDILLGSSGFKDLNNPPTIYKLQFYKNVGTAAYPAFNLVNDDFLNASTLSVKDLVPAAGDIDNDNDTDIIVGISDGRIIYWENTANIGSTPNYIFRGILKNSSNTDINVGANATPYIIDINKDGITDLIIGERNGNINFYKGNSNNSAAFSFVTDSVGKILTTFQTNKNGFTQPVIKDIDNDGKLDLLLGTSFLGIHFYSNIEDSIVDRVKGSAPIITDVLGNRITSTIDDITNDGKWEIITGNISGGLTIYSQDPPPFQPTAIINNEYSKLNFDIYPNPANTTVFIQLQPSNNNIELVITNNLGQDIYKQSTTNDTFKVDIQSLPNGIYLIKIYDGEKEGIRKLVVQH
jgi:hypothetical protein